MRIPADLAEMGKKRIADFPVEGFVFGSGPAIPKLMLVGEAPGETEIENGIPFSGRAGKKLMDFLEGLGLSREQVYITSAVRSRPYKWKIKNNRDGTTEKKKYNRPPTDGEIRAHAPLLDYELKHVQAPIVVTLGNVGLRRLLGNKYKVTEVHGQFIHKPVLHLTSNEEYILSEKEYIVFPTFHPASIFYNPKLRDLIIEDKSKLKGWIESNI